MKIYTIASNETREWHISILVALFLLPITLLCAQQRSVGAAISIAQSFGKRPYAASSGSASLCYEIEKSSDILNEPTLKSAGLEAFYVITPQSGIGYIVVSGDVRMRPILGFSDTETFRRDSLPENVRGWFQQYANEMMSLDAMSAPPVDDIDWFDNGSEESLLASLPIHDEGVSPLLGSIKWNQTSPYYNQCPIDNDGKRCVTGCVATAMAQVMKYHQYPSAGSGSVSYTTRSHNLNVTASLGATYHWSQMLDSYSGDYSSTQADEVALLMFHCGAVLRMDYTSEASGAYQDDIRNSLYEYFGYDSDMAYVSRSNFTDQAWHTLLLTEINADRPVNYSGSSGLSGHSFVLDGYKLHNDVDVPYYHVNWGWAGYCDGYYLLSSLAPSSTGTGGGNGNYNEGQAMVIGVKAEDGSYSTPVLEGSFDTSSTIFRYGEANTMTYSFSVANRACRSFTGDLKLVAISGSGQETILQTYQRSSDLPTDFRTSYNNQTISIPSSLSVGSYRLEWRANYTGKNSYGTVYFPAEYSIIIYGESPQLVASAQSSSAVISPAEEYRLTLKVKNTGNSTFEGTISAHLHQDTYDVSLTSEACSIAPNSTSDVIISGYLRTMAPSDVTITFTNDLDNNAIKDSSGQPLTIHTTAEAATSDVSVSSMSVFYTSSSRVFSVYSYNFLNNSSINFIGDIQLALIDDNDHILCHLGSIWSNDGEGLGCGYYYTYARTFNDEFPSTIPNGHYRLVTIARQANSGIWTIAKQWYSSAIQYLDVEVSSYWVLIDDMEFDKDPFDGTVLVSSIALKTNSATLLQNETLQLMATVAPSTATNKAVTWSTSNSQIASVNSAGIVTAKAEGTTTITAKTTDGSNLSASCRVTVIKSGYTDISKIKYGLYTTEASSLAGQQIDVTINMKNANAITSWQADLVLPEGITMAKDSYGDPLIWISGSRTTSSKHSISTATLSDGSIRLFCMSTTNKTFSGTDGEVATMTLNVAENVSAGDYPIDFTNISLVEALSDNHWISRVSSKLNVNHYRVGDVNNDGEINSIDLVGIVAYILDTPIEGNIREAADLNHDEIINNVDYVAEVNVILGLTSIDPMLTTMILAGTDRLSIDQFEIANGKTATVSVRLDADSYYSSVQFDMMLPTGMRVTDCNSLSLSHSLSYNQLEDGRIRFLMTSFRNDCLPAGDIIALTFEADKDLQFGEYQITMDEICLVKANTEYVCQDTEYVSFCVGNANSIDNMPDDTDKANIYNIYGQKIEVEHDAVATSGIQIIDGNLFISK